MLSARASVPRRACSGGEIRLPLPEQAGNLASKANRFDRLSLAVPIAQPGLPEMSSFTVTRVASTVAARIYRRDRPEVVRYILHSVGHWCSHPHRAGQDAR